MVVGMEVSEKEIYPKAFLVVVVASLIHRLLFRPDWVALHLDILEKMELILDYKKGLD